MEPSRLVFRDVRVAGAPPVEFCVDPPAGDPVAAWLLEHDSIDEPVMRAFLGLVGHGSRVIDLGSHLGTFSLPAAVLGAQVLAVDASARHVYLLRTAARRNCLASLEVIHGALSDSGQAVPFIEQSIHGRLWTAREDHAPTTTAPVARIDDLLESREWDSVDVIKMDIEGSEPAALRGMARLLERGVRPAIVFECNGGMLPWFGSSVEELRASLTGLGYELLLIDHLRPGTLVEVNSDSVQTECVCDYLALTSRPAALSEDWTIEPPFSSEQTLTRLLDTASGPEVGYRRYAADLLTSGPAWLRSEPMAIAARRALGPHVRRAARLMPDEPTPGPTGDAPSDSVVLAEALNVSRPSEEPERAGSGAHLFDQPLVQDAWFYVRPGQSLALLADDPIAGSALLHVVGGIAQPAGGHLRVRGRATLLSEIGALLEPELSIGENVLMFAAFLGCDVRAVSAGVADVAGRAGVGHVLDTPLREVAPEIPTLLALTVATELAEPKLLLIDRLGEVGDEPFRRWFADRAAQLRQRRTALVQVIEPGQELLATADRMLWVDRAGIGTYGHPDLVLEARRRAGGAWPPQAATG